jgi:hypothetical protein
MQPDKARSFLDMENAISTPGQMLTIRQVENGCTAKNRKLR